VGPRLAQDKNCDCVKDAHFVLNQRMLAWHVLHKVIVKKYTNKQMGRGQSKSLDTSVMRVCGEPDDPKTHHHKYKITDRRMMGGSVCHQEGVQGGCEGWDRVRRR
jgi:hypothetical protein